MKEQNKKGKKAGVVQRFFLIYKNLETKIVPSTNINEEVPGNFIPSPFPIPVDPAARLWLQKVTSLLSLESTLHSKPTSPFLYHDDELPA